MKNLFIMPLLIFLTGCVTYYYPETALEDGVYYAGDDPSYILNSGDYSGVVYYPWSSLDYFYLGYWPYPRYGFVYGYPYGLGYSPWDFPNGYYGYYSPWYFPHQHGYYWRPYRRNCSYPGTCSRHHNGKRYAQDEIGRRGNRSRDDGNDEHSPGNDSDINENSIPSKRYITTPPPGYSGEQGMVVRSSEGSKMGNSRTQPVKPVSSKPVSVRSSRSGTVRRSSSSMNSRPSRSAVVSSPSRRYSSGKSSTSQRRDRD